MEGSMVRDVLVQWGPTAVLAVAGISVALVVVSFGVLLVTHLLGEKKPEHGAHDDHAHEHGHAAH
jgi:hypothetical protein